MDFDSKVYCGHEQNHKTTSRTAPTPAEPPEPRAEPPGIQTNRGNANQDHEQNTNIMLEPPRIQKNSGNANQKRQHNHQSHEQNR